MGACGAAPLDGSFPPDSMMMLPDGMMAPLDGSVMMLPDGMMAPSDGSMMMLPDGMMAPSDGSMMMLPDGMMAPSDGNMMMLPDGMMAPLDIPPPPDAGPPCPAGQIMCAGACVSFLTSASHCGGCNRPCAAGQTCAAGACAGEPPPMDGGMACGVGLTPCDGFCVNTATSAAHCGACGRACPSGRACAAGACAAGMDAGVDVTCPTGLTPCGAVCVDTRGSMGNCGGCGNSCPVGTLCGNGTCVMPGPTDGGVDAACPAGQVRCVDRCVDITSDQGHCGGCGNSCPVGTTCASGVCQSMMATPDGGSGGMCTVGMLACGGVCVSIGSDPRNCGMCGRACPAGQTCLGGGCGVGGGGDGGAGGGGQLGLPRRPLGLRRRLHRHRARRPALRALRQRLPRRGGPA